MLKDKDKDDDKAKNDKAKNDKVKDDDKAKDDEKRFTVTVIYNGLPKPLEVNARQAVQSVLSRALELFGSPQSVEPILLFNEAGAELGLHQKVEEAGILPGARLLLRTRVVRGG